MKRPFAAYAYGPGPDAENFWRGTVAPCGDFPALAGDRRCDFAVIGAGYTGLSAALRLVEAGAEVCVLDANSPGWGASGRNGGFCCLGGSALSEAAMIRRHGAKDVRLYHDAERAAITVVEDNLRRLNIDADRHSEGETMLAHSPRRLGALRRRAALIKRLYGVDCAFRSVDEMRAGGMRSPEFHGALTVPIGFALNPLKYALGVAAAARAGGAGIFADSPVRRIEPAAGAGYVLASDRGTLRARRLILATNGYSSDDVPPWLAGRYLPVQSSILVSRPLTEGEIDAQGWTSGQMAYDTRRHLHYLRLIPDRRVLFGMRGGARSSPDQMKRMRARSRADFDRIFPQWRHVETPHFWSGLICANASLTPFAGAIPDMEGAWAAMAYHGNGVAMASLCGRVVAEAALGLPPTLPWPAMMRKPPARIPFGTLRSGLLHAADRWHRLTDRR